MIAAALDQAIRARDGMIPTGSRPPEGSALLTCAVA
jgi:hypothetical protein